jgi:DNA-binding response OmpR family regulator
MNRSTVLVISSVPPLAGWLEERLSPERFTVCGALPGPELVAAVRQCRPDVAVLDGIHARPGLAQLEVALLKDQCTGVQIIALSDDSSELDGGVIEQGIFCYLAGHTLEELVRVIEAAARERPARSEVPTP